MPKLTTPPRFLAAALAVAASPAALAQNLLTFGDFETPAFGEVPFWELQEFRTGNPSALVDSGELVEFANNPNPSVPPGERGLWLRSFVGNPTDGTAEAILTQSVPATPLATYSFRGEALFEENYAGGVAELASNSPFGAVPSPTDTLFELAFLDSAGAVIGAPIVRDLATEVLNGIGYTAVSPLVGQAPANAARVRVRAIGAGLAFNTDPAQTAFLDNFSLTTSSAPTTELLQNASLNSLPPTAESVLDDVFVFGEDPSGSDSLAIAGFANNPATGGAQGVWVRPFIAAGQGGTATLSQAVAGVAGTEYTFSAGSRFETNFVGDGADPGNDTSIELAFLDDMGAVLSSVSLDLRADGKTSAQNSWSTHSVTGTAPAGTAQVRVAGIVANITNNTVNGGGQSAFWDDFVLTAASAALPGDYNGDGNVDAADYTVWRDGNSPDDTDAGRLLWATNYGRTTGGGGAVAISVPEPSTALLMLLGLAVPFAARRV